MVSIFTTREIATAIWMIIFIVFCLSIKSIRKQIPGLLKVTFDKKLMILYSIIIGYVAIITYGFYKSIFWKNIFLKDILVWFIFTGFITCINAVMNKEGYIKKKVYENIKITVIIEFLISMFTFSLVVEMIMIPVLSIIAIMDVIAEREEKYESAHKLFQFLLVTYGLVVLYQTIQRTISEYRELYKLDTVICFLIPIVYTLLMVPLEYCLEVFSAYQSLFIRMSFKEKDDKKLQRKNHFQIIKICRLSVKRIRIFQNNYLVKMYKMMREEEFQSIIDDFIKEIKNT